MDAPLDAAGVKEVQLEIYYGLERAGIIIYILYVLCQLLVIVKRDSRQMGK